MRLLTYGICLVVFCLPLYLVRFEIFGIPTTVLELMIYVLFIVWGVKFILERDTNYKWHTNLRIIIPIVLILVGVSLATIFSSDLRTSAGIWKGWFVDPLLFFIVVISVVKNSSQIKKVLYSLFLSGTVVAIISLVYLIQGKLDPVGRLQAFYNSPNHLVMYLAPVLIIGAGYYVFTFLGRPSEAASGTLPSLVPLRGTPCLLGLVTRKNIIPRTFILLSIVYCLLSVILFFTKSYGAWLGILATIGFGLIVYLFKSKKKLAWIILILTLIIVSALGYLALIQRESSFDARLIIWQKAWQIFRTNPILGIGPGTFGNYFPPYPEWGVPQPHNIFLAFLLQTGLIGFIGFIWLLIRFFKSGFKLQVTSYKLQVIGLMSIMVYILVHGLFDTTYWKNDLSIIFWLMIGLMAVLKNHESQITNISNKF